MKLCDLHTHSVFSDGTFTPEQSVDLAIEKGLSAIALTDHDTVSGLDRFASYAEDKPIEAVLGIEFSTGIGRKELHILALFLNRESFGTISDYVKKAEEFKEISNQKLEKKLNENGYKVDYARLKSSMPDARINRAHFAAELFRLGYVGSVKEAFDTVLSEKQGWYEPPERIETLDTIEFIRSIGAVPVWAHPLINMSYEECEAFLPAAKERGLVGIETIYSEYSEADTEFAKRMCEKFNLLESGGSDFHGANKPDIALGNGRGNLEIPYEFCERLKAAKT